jgi:hypothetical protein
MIDVLGSVSAPITNTERSEVRTLAAEMLMTNGSIKPALEKRPRRD